MLEEPLEGTAPLTSDRTGESWTANYKITHSTEVVALARYPGTRTTSVVTVRTEADLRPGQYTLHTPEEIVFLELANGKWEIRN
jgi:hypothetical protein